MPPYLAGRQAEETEFRRLLTQDTVLENLVLTGLRGLGKTVLSEKLKPIAINEGWLWVGTDMSEAISISESNLAIRVITDLAVVTSTLSRRSERQSGGFLPQKELIEEPLNYKALMELFEQTPGLISDKLKAVLEFVWAVVQTIGKRGIVFAYDEAQNLADNAAREQYPLSILLDVFQSIQRKDIRFMLVLVGLPTLFPKLVDARTYAERMFRVLSLAKLDEKESADAIVKPVADAKCSISFAGESVRTITQLSGGYPYFIQFICREVYDVWIQQLSAGFQPKTIPADEITRKLDTDFFAGRWAKATDRQRELLWIIAQLPNCDNEFTVQEIVDGSSDLENSFSNSHANQMLVTLANSGLVYKNRHGKYSFAVPLMSGFIRRQHL